MIRAYKQGKMLIYNKGVTEVNSQNPGQQRAEGQSQVCSPRLLVMVHHSKKSNEENAWRKIRQDELQKLTCFTKGVPSLRSSFIRTRKFLIGIVSVFLANK